jgi:hypothetical protein
MTKNRPNVWLVGCEESGRVRDALIARGIPACSCDLLPSRSDGPHIQGDIMASLYLPGWAGGIFFPDCTYLTCSAEWAYGPGPYHMNLKPGTLTGEARRAARICAVDFALSLWNSMDRVIIENPVGVLSRHLGKPQVVQPYMFGDDASKATCLWIKGMPPLEIPDRSRWFPPRMVNGKPRWGNQTDGGQNKLSPGPNRARDRSETYHGIAAALADHIAKVSA